ncbi:MAG: DNA primase [Elusimicrobiota bacterium]
MVKPEIIDQIRETTDIVEIVEEYFPLKKTGANYKALCPFHQEKTPSFVVSPGKQIFHCFGCGESGNVFSFIMKMERIDFIEAVKKLASRNGIELKMGDNKNYKSKKNIKKELLNFNRRAACYFNKYLNSSKGTKAKDYLKSRGVSKETIEKFKIGFSPDGNILSGNALGEGVSEKILIKSGLAGRGSSGKIYDKFKNRIIFPIHDERGDIRGFGGRVLEQKKLPKYLNTPQNEVFEKRKMMYGFFQGKNKIKQAKRIIVLEGYMDVVAAHQYGITNSVATLGTSLTREHIYKLKHWTEEVVLAFDSDSAGKKAAFRAGEILLDSQMRGKVCVLPAGKDPDDIIRKESDKFMDYIESAQTILDWRIDFSKSKFKNVKDPVDKKVEIVRDLVPMLVKINKPVKYNETVRRISEEFKISEKAIRQEAKSIPKGKRSYLKQKAKILNKNEKIFREMLHAVIKYDELEDEIEDIIACKLEQDCSHFKLLKEYVMVYKGDIHKMIAKADSDAKKILTELSFKPLKSTNPEDYIVNLKKELKKAEIERRYREISKKINDLIKNNKPVNEEIKKEHKRLGIELKRKGRSVKVDF